MATKNILIALPAYGGAIKTACAMSLIKLSAYLLTNRITHKTIPIDMASVDIPRNIFGSLIMQEKQFSHVLFKDSDMQSEPSDFERLREANKNIVGFSYPTRTIDLRALFDLAATHSFEQAVSKASKFGLYIAEAKSRPIEKGICEVDGIGMGFALIKRETFEQMAATEKLRKMTTHSHGHLGLNGPLYGFFDPIKTNENDFGEDISFCLRWRDLCGGKTFAIIDGTLGHVGEFTYRANYRAGR